MRMATTITAAKASTVAVKNNKVHYKIFIVCILLCVVYSIYDIVAVEEDHRGGTASEESDVTSITIGRKGTAGYR
jgi:hypothetical protein